jgi:hypothetical protein
LFHLLTLHLLYNSNLAVCRNDRLLLRASNKFEMNLSLTGGKNLLVHGLKEDRVPDRLLLLEEVWR